MVGPTAYSLHRIYHFTISILIDFKENLTGLSVTTIREIIGKRSHGWISPGTLEVKFWIVKSTGKIWIKIKDIYALWKH